MLPLSHLSLLPPPRTHRPYFCRGEMTPVPSATTHMLTSPARHLVRAQGACPQVQDGRGQRVRRGSAPPDCRGQAQRGARGEGVKVARVCVCDHEASGGDMTWDTCVEIWSRYGRMSKWFALCVPNSVSGCNVSRDDSCSTGGTCDAWIVAYTTTQRWALMTSSRSTLFTLLMYYIHASYPVDSVLQRCPRSQSCNRTVQRTSQWTK